MLHGLNYTFPRPHIEISFFPSVNSDKFKLPLDTGNTFGDTPARGKSHRPAFSSFLELRGQTRCLEALSFMILQS